MTERIHRVLFVCTGNSARSILAEGLLNALGQGRFVAFSAGSQPKSAIHPLALAELRRLGIPTGALRSKSWAEFAAPGAAPMDLVITVCDQAAGEACPFWPGQPVTAHWGMPDPAAVAGTDDAKGNAFGAAVVTLKRRIERLLALPLQTLDSTTLQRQVADIGKRD